MDMKWNTENPTEHGYYLGAWNDGINWVVSELWFNPKSIGSGWWATRGYLCEGPRNTKTINVKAWMAIPVYNPEVQAVK